MANTKKNIRLGIELYLDGKEVKTDIRAVEGEAKKLKAELRGMKLGSEEYIQTMKKIRQLDKVLREHGNAIREVEQQQQSLLKKGINLFKDYSLQIAGAMAAITGVAMKLNQFRKQAAEKEDAAANLKALTGLDDSNIAWLTEQADKLSTTMEKSGLRVRKSATEILEAYMLVGSAKPELLKNKEALNAVTIEAMRLAEAAKMELKDSVDAVTIALNQYNAGADQAIRFTNVLAAGSKYGAANVQAQAAAIKNSGVAAASAGLSIEQHVGIIEMLAEKGIKAEEAGTALKGVFLKLQTGADDTNPAIVGLDKALENLAAKGMSAGEILKMFDRRGFNAAKILIDNTEKVKEYTKAVTGTNVAIEQAAINSDTAAAKLAQIRNQISLTGQELAKTLAPAFSVTVGWTRKFVLAMPAMIDFLKKWGVQLAILAVAYNALTIKVKVASAMQASWNAVTGLGKSVGFGLRAMLLTLHAGYTLLTKGMAAAKVEMAAVNAVMKANAFGILVTAGIALYEIISRLVNRTKDLTKEQRLQRDMTGDIKKAQEEGNRESAQSVSKIRQLSAVLHDNNRSLKDRRTALGELKKIVPGYEAALTKEGRLINDNTEALKRYIRQLKSVAVQKALQGRMEKLVEAELNEKDSLKRRQNAVRVRRDRLSAFDAEYQNDDIIQSLLRNGIGANQLNYGGGYMAVSRWMEKYDVGRHKAERQISAIIGQRTKLVADIKEAEDWVNEEDDRIEKIQKRQENLQKQGYDIIKTLPEVKTPSNPEPEEPPTTPEATNNDKKETERAERIRKELSAIDAEYNKRAADLKQQYIDGEIEKEEDYAAKVQALELESLQKKMDVVGLEPEKQEEIRLKILNIKQKLIDGLREMDAAGANEEERRLNEQLDKNRKAAQDKLNILESAKAAGLVMEEEYQQKRQAILDQQAAEDKKAYEQKAGTMLNVSRKSLTKVLFNLRQQRAEEHMTERQYDTLILEAKMRFYERLLQDQSLSNEQREQLQQEYDSTVLESVEKRNSELEEKNRKMFDMLESAGQEIGSALAEIFTDSEKDFGDFMQSLLVILLDSMEKMLAAYIAEITMRNVTKLGPFGLAKAAGEIALITAAFETAKAAIKGFEEGGFTPDGRKDEPQGVVHSNEFVANRFAVKNPQVLPVLQLIDYAQRSGSISHLTGNEIAAVASGHAPSSRVSAYLPASQQAQNIDLSPLFTTLRRLEKVMDRATDAYKKPSKAYCFINGEGGIKEAMELDEKITKNASFK